MSLEIVIVGGGPIGCWTALQAKKRNPNLNIVVYERFESYRRDHIMTIRRRSITHCQQQGKTHEDFILQLFSLQSTCSELCRSPGSTKFSRRIKLPRVLDIRTIDFERFVKEECEAAGVTFVYKRVEFPEDVMDAHPSCKQFIAADGANSKMRTALWGLGCVYRRDILPSLDFKYKAVGQPRYLLKSTFSDLAHIGLENIGMMGPDGLSDVNLRFVVSQRDYDCIPAATFNEPLIVTPNSPFWERMGQKRLYGKRTFRDDFYTFLQMRQEFADERIADAPITMTKIYLSRYAAREFSKTINYGGRRRAWFLAGDAAMGMPFYRSINSGIILGSQLGLLLSKELAASRKAMIYNSVNGLSRWLRFDQHLVG